MKYKMITTLLAVLLAGCAADTPDKSTSKANKADVAAKVGTVDMDSGCAGKYVDGTAPTLTNDKLKAKTQELCFLDYAVLHSGVTRTPLWTAEHLTKKGLAKQVERDDDFHAELSLPRDQRAELADYAKSGYDRGHLAPAGDMTSDKGMRESFSLANMTPQLPAHNRGLWSSLEKKTRDLATKRGDLYVVSGVIFAGSSIKRLNKRVFVPTSYFKAVYDPKTGESGAYLVPHDDSKDYETVSIDELVKVAGIEPFPTVSASSKAKAMTLPTVGAK
jgi:endonuclease G